MSQQEEYPEDLNTLKTHQRHVGLGRTMWSVFTYYTVAGDPLDPEHMVSTAASSQHPVVRTRGYRHCPPRKPILSSTEGVRDSRRRIARTHQHTNPSRAHSHTHTRTHTHCTHTHTHHLRPTQTDKAFDTFCRHSGIQDKSDQSDFEVEITSADCDIAVGSVVRRQERGAKKFKLTYRDWLQAIKLLSRKAYPDASEIVAFQRFCDMVVVRAHRKVSENYSEYLLDERIIEIYQQVHLWQREREEKKERRETRDERSKQLYAQTRLRTSIV